MPDPTPTPRRRRLFAATGLALVGGAAAAVPSGVARAADGAALLLGRANAASRSTILTATGTGTALRVGQLGTAVAVACYSRAATAVLGSTAVRTAWGVHGQNLATTAGTGGAVRAEGRRSAGLFADTARTQLNVPAIVAIGGDGTGIAQVNTGETYLDGDLLALRSWVGVPDAGGSGVLYAAVVSGEGGQHSSYGTATLDGGGAAQVVLPAGYLAAVDTTTVTAVVSPVGTAMPGLHVVYRTAASGPPGGRDGFAVVGGAPSGTVTWVAWAQRGTVAAPSTAAGERGEPAARAGRRGTARVPRREMEMPAR